MRGSKGVKEEVEATCASEGVALSFDETALFFGLPPFFEDPLVPGVGSGSDWGAGGPAPPSSKYDIIYLLMK